MPITPSSKNYTLKNVGNAPMVWSVSTSQTWLDVSPESGTLQPGDSIVVTITFNAEADALPPSADPYTSQIFLSNSINGCGSISLKAILTKPLPPPPTEAPPFSWGSNFAGELSFGGDFDDKLVPTEITFSPSAVKFAGGSEVSILLDSDGSLWSCGSNFRGTLGLGDFSDRTSLTKIGLDVDWSDITIGSNSLHACSLKLDGTLWSWGEGLFGQIGNGSTSNQSSPVQIGLSSWLKIAGGSGHTIAIKSDGTLWSWGRGGQGQLGLGGTSNFSTPQQVGSDSDWLSVAAGSLHSIAIKTNGTLWACGSNQGQIGDGTTTQRNSLVQIGVDVTWVTVTGLSSDSIGIKSDGTMWGWGFNDAGQLGLGDESQRLSPVKIGTDTNWLSCSGGDDFSLALKTSGTLWSSGWNGNTQLGLGDYTNRNVFTQSGISTKWTSVSAGESHSLGIQSP